MRKLALFSAGFAAAAAIFVYLVRDVRALWIAGACLALSPLAFRFGFKRCCAVFLGLSAGLLWCVGYQQLALAPAEKLYGTEQTVTVTLTEDPVSTTYGSRAIAKLETGGKSYIAALYGKETLLEAAAGDRVTAEVRIEPSGLEIEDGESLYLRSDGVSLCLFAESDLTMTHGQPKWPARVRQYLQNQIHAHYTGETAGLLRALLTGDRSELSYAVQNDLSVAGLSHAVAVSGMHVSMLMAMVALFCGYNPRLTALIGIPLVVLFVLMTGASPSACRAAVMQILLLSAPLVRREQDTLTSLSAAALVLLLQNPWAIASVSFQLSFAAVLGLIVLGKPLQNRLLQLRKEPGRLWQYLASGASASLSATIATLPLTVYYFGLISIAAVLTNLLALWAVTVVFSLGAVSCFFDSLGGILAIPVSWLARYILGLCRFVAQFPYAAAYPQNLPLMLWAAAAYGILCLFLLTKYKKHLPALSILTAAFLACILWGRCDLTRGDPVYRVLDVGQGQATSFEHDGFTVVLDCGGSYPSEAGEQIVRTLHSGGQTHVDAVILTHYDADHAGGVLQLLHRVKPGMLLLPDVPDDSGMRLAIEQAAASAGCPVTMVSTLTELEFSDGKLTVFPPVSRENDNNGGICVLASAAEYDILITGDLDRFMEMRLISQWQLPQAELLVAGHHGAASSTSTILLETVCPKTVAISVGADNYYGHPSAETLERIQAAGAAVYRTDLQGTLVFRK